MRQPSYAGTWYPNDPVKLRELVNKFLNKAKRIDLKNPRALIVPHAALIYSGIVAASGYKILPPGITRVFLLGPSHHALFSGIMHPGTSPWKTPLGEVKIFKPEFEVNFSERIHKIEHCLEVQLPFLQVVLKNFTLCPLLLGKIEPAELAENLSKEIDKQTIVIASSDLSHYHPYEEAKKLDAVANRAIPALDIKTVEEKVEACGKVAILTVMNLAKIKNWKGLFLDYQNSGDTAGDKNFVVGYGCYAFLK